jgi:hypothetical protein
MFLPSVIVQRSYNFGLFFGFHPCRQAKSPLPITGRGYFYDCLVKKMKNAGNSDPLLHPSRECIPGGSIRGIFGLRLSFFMIFFEMCMQKTIHFYTLFQNTLFPWGSGQTGQHPSSYKTLIDPNGRQNEGWLDR